MDKAIVVMVIGEKYQKLFKYKEKMLREYADKCDSNLVIIKKELDSQGHRSVLAQKMLIPYEYCDYKELCFLDLDIHISNKAPSIFSGFDPRYGFSAVLDPRGSSRYLRTWKDYPDVLVESTSNYFEKRGFKPNDNVIGSINGGVLLFRPDKVARMYYDYYWSDHRQNNIGDGNEEAPLAYLSQTNKLFLELDERYNRQFIYYWKGTDEEKFHESKIDMIYSNTIYKILKKATNFDYVKILNIREYKRFILENMRDSYIVHMAGGFETRFDIYF